MRSSNLGINPRDAISPRSQWRLIDVLHESATWSMALGRWRDGKSERPVLAQRWNGGEGEKGSPVSHGFPTWFILPDDTYRLYLESSFIPDGKRAFVKEILGL